MADFPLKPESVTVDWLTDILRRSNTIDSETSVTTVEWHPIAEDAGFTSNLFRFSVGYSSSITAPDSFVGKFQIEDPHMKIPESWLYLARKEVRFNQEIDDPGVAIPQCHFAGIDERNQVFLLLGDLGSKDWPDQLISATPEQSTLVIKALAKLHAKWWNHPDLADFSWMNQTVSVDQTERVTEFQKSVAQFNTAFGESCPQIKEIGDMLVKLLQASPAQVGPTNATGNRTLCHGDVRLDNLCFVGNDVVFVDWQLVSPSSAVSDLTFWLCCNYRPADRRDNEENILQMYSRELKNHGVDYPLKKLKADVRFQLIGRCLGRLGTFSLISDTVFASDRGRQFLAYDLQGLEAMLVDYKVVRYARLFGFFLFAYIRFRKLLRL